MTQNQFNYGLLIKKTEDPSTPLSDFVNICADIEMICKLNISLALKLVSNILNNKTIISSNLPYTNFDIVNLRTIALQNEEKINDGDIVSLVNIYCSKKLNQYVDAIEIIKKYNIHKTSTYLPIFNNLIENKNFNAIKGTYNMLLEQNVAIVEDNMRIKEDNYKISKFNEKIKIIKQQTENLYKNCNEISSLSLNYNPCEQFYQVLTNLNMKMFDELTPRSDKNLIELSTPVITSIIELGIENNDVQFVNKFITGIQTQLHEIMPTLIKFFNTFSTHQIIANIENGICSHCGKQIKNNILCPTTKTTILDIIENNINEITIKHSSGKNLSKNEKQHISTTWNIFKQMLEQNNFDIVVDCANIAYQFGNINIKTIQKAVNSVLNKINKKILLVIHQRHINEIHQLETTYKNNNYIVIFTAPINTNDDWFWLYAALYNNCFVVTNDQSRDHACMTSYQTELKKWFEYYQVKINENGCLPEQILMSKNSVLSSGIVLEQNIFHIITSSNIQQQKCLCVHMK